jgi:hypothetical protein
MTAKQAALTRLKEIDCNSLPIRVRDAVVSEFVSLAEAKLISLANRHISRSKVARAFLKSSTNSGGVIDHLALPPGECETISLAGTPPLKKIII